MTVEGERLLAAAKRLDAIVEYVGDERGMQDVIVDGEDIDDLKLVLLAARAFASSLNFEERE